MDEPTPERWLVPQYGQKVPGSHYVLWLHLFIVWGLFFVKQYLGEKKNKKKTKRFQNNMHCLYMSPGAKPRKVSLAAFVGNKVEINLTR